MSISYQNAIPVNEAKMCNLIEVSEAYARSVPAEGFVLVSGDTEKVLVPIMDADTASILANSDLKCKFVVYAKASLADVSTLIRTLEEIELLQAEAEEIKSRIQQDASLALSNTAYGTYSINTPAGSVEVTNKDTIEVINAPQLKAFLKDDADQLICAKPATYKVNGVLSSVLSAIEKDMLLDKLPEEFIDQLAEQLGDTNLKYEKTRRVLKKTFAANVKVFMNTFGMGYDEAVDTATLYQMSLNWELLCKIAVSAGWDIHGSDWDQEWKEFAKMLRDYAVVKQTAALTVRR